MAGLDIKIDWSGVKDQFVEYANSEAKRLALKAREEICKEYLCTIGDFYAEFDPKVWRRQFGYLRSFQPFYQNSHGTIYYGGIDINSSAMRDSHYQYGAEDALYTMLSGIHGPLSGRGPAGINVYGHMEAFIQHLARYISL